jgi:hypothetical protein
MNRIEPTMPNNATLQKIALATGDFKQMYQAPVMHAVEKQTDEERALAIQYLQWLEKKEEALTKEECMSLQNIRFLQLLFKTDDDLASAARALIKEEKDLELDENNYYLNQLSPLAYKAA